MLILDYVLCCGVDTVGVADRARGILTCCVPKKAARDEFRAVNEYPNIRYSFVLKYSVKEG